MLGEPWFRLTICARYGMDPAGPWFDSLEPAMVALLVGYEKAELKRKR